MRNSKKPSTISTSPTDSVLDREGTFRVTWLNSKPFVVTSTLRYIGFEYAGCTIEPVSDSELRRIERKEYEAELARKKFKKAKR